MRFYKSRAVAIGDFSPVVTGDELGNIFAYGDDGTDDDTLSSGIVFKTEGTISTGQVPGVIELRTAPAGTLVTGLRVTSSQDVEIPSGILYVNETANAKMTTGLTINQGAADDEILALKSSDVAHGITDLAETDTFGAFYKIAAANGGILIRGFTEAETGIHFVGYGTNDNTAKTTSANSYVVVDCRKKLNTGSQVPGANANLLTVKSQGITRFIFDNEGSAHADVEWITFDAHDDLQIIEDMETLLAPGQVRRMFGEVVKYDRAFFEREGLLHDVRDVGDGRTRGMLNQTGTLMLHSGAIRSLGGRVIEIETREGRLENCVRHLVGVNPTLEGREEALALLEAA